MGSRGIGPCPGQGDVSDYPLVKKITIADGAGASNPISRPSLVKDDEKQELQPYYRLQKPPGNNSNQSKAHREKPTFAVSACSCATVCEFVRDI